MLPKPAVNPRLSVSAVVPSSVLLNRILSPIAVPTLVVSIAALPVKTVAPLKVTAPLAVVIVNAPMEIVPAPVETKVRLPAPSEEILAPMIMFALFAAVIVRDVPVSKLVSSPVPLMVIIPVPVPPVPVPLVVTVTLVVASCVLISAHCKLETLAVLSVVKAPPVLVTSEVAALLISKSDGSKSNIPVCPFAARVLTVPR